MIYSKIHSEWSYMRLKRWPISMRLFHWRGPLDMKVESKTFLYFWKSCVATEKKFLSIHLHLLFSILVLLPVIHWRVRPRKITERRSCWIQHRVLSSVQCPAFVFTTIMLDLGSWAHCGCIIHFNSGAECVIQAAKNWLLRHYRQRSNQMLRCSKRDGKINAMYKTWICLLIILHVS